LHLDSYSTLARVSLDVDSTKKFSNNSESSRTHGDCEPARGLTHMTCPPCW